MQGSDKTVRSDACCSVLDLRLAVFHMFAQGGFFRVGLVSEIYGVILLYI